MKDATVSLIRKQPEFSKARVNEVGTLGVREAGSVCGDYVLSRSDVLEARKFKDAACRCCWPIEYWHPDTGVSLTYLPAGSYYEIPLRALKLQGLGNVWCAGKCLSADRYAQASARVAGCCWSMGEAVGKAAAAVASAAETAPAEWPKQPQAT